MADDIKGKSPDTVPRRPKSDIGSKANDIYKNRIRNISAMSDVISKKIDKSSYSNKKDIQLIQRQAYDKDVKKSISLMDKSLLNLQLATKNLALGVKNMTVSAATGLKSIANAGVNSIGEYSRAIGEDISINRQSFAVTTLGRVSPLIGYSVAKLMETTVFKNMISRMKEGLGNALSSVTTRFKSLAGLGWEKAKDFASGIRGAFTSKKGEREREIAEKREAKVSALAKAKAAKEAKKSKGKVPHMQTGGYVTKGGLARVHAAEVVQPVEKVVDLIVDQVNDKVKKTKNLAGGDATGSLNKFTKVVKKQLDHSISLSSGLQMKFLTHTEDLKKSMQDTAIQISNSTKMEEKNTDLINRSLARISGSLTQRGGIADYMANRWRQMLNKHPFFAGMMALGRTLTRSFTLPVRFLFKQRNRYFRDLPNSGPPIQRFGGILSQTYSKNAEFTDMVANGLARILTVLEKKPVSAKSLFGPPATWNVARSLISVAGRVVSGGVGIFNKKAGKALDQWFNRKGGRAFTGLLKPITAPIEALIKKFGSEKAIENWTTDEKFGNWKKQLTSLIDRHLVRSGFKKPKSVATQEPPEEKEKRSSVIDHLRFIGDNVRYIRYCVCDSKKIEEKAAKEQKKSNTSSKKFENKSVKINLMRFREQKKQSRILGVIKKAGRGTKDMIIKGAMFLGTIFSNVWGKISPLFKLFKPGGVLLKILGGLIRSPIFLAIAGGAAIGGTIGTLINKYAIRPVIDYLDKKQEKKRIKSEVKSSSREFDIAKKAREGTATSQELIQLKTGTRIKTSLALDKDLKEKRKRSFGSATSPSQFNDIMIGQNKYIDENINFYSKYGPKQIDYLRKEWLDKNGFRIKLNYENPIDYGFEREASFAKYVKSKGIPLIPQHLKQELGIYKYEKRVETSKHSTSTASKALASMDRRSEMTTNADIRRMKSIGKAGLPTPILSEKTKQFLVKAQGALGKAIEFAMPFTGLTGNLLGGAILEKLAKDPTAAVTIAEDIVRYSKLAKGKAKEVIDPALLKASEWVASKKKEILEGKTGEYLNKAKESFNSFKDYSTVAASVAMGKGRAALAELKKKGKNLLSKVTDYGFSNKSLSSAGDVTSEISKKSTEFLTKKYKEGTKLYDKLRNSTPKEIMEMARTEYGDIIEKSGDKISDLREQLKGKTPEDAIKYLDDKYGTLKFKAINIARDATNVLQTNKTLSNLEDIATKQNVKNAVERVKNIKADEVKNWATAQYGQAAKMAGTSYDKLMDEIKDMTMEDAQKYLQKKYGDSKIAFERKIRGYKDQLSEVNLKEKAINAGRKSTDLLFKGDIGDVGDSMTKAKVADAATGFLRKVTDWFFTGNTGKIGDMATSEKLTDLQKRFNSFKNQLTVKSHTGGMIKATKGQPIIPIQTQEGEAIFIATPSAQERLANMGLDSRSVANMQVSRDLRNASMMGALVNETRGVRGSLEKGQAMNGKMMSVIMDNSSKVMQSTTTNNSQNSSQDYQRRYPELTDLVMANIV